MYNPSLLKTVFNYTKPVYLSKYAQYSIKSKSGKVKCPCDRPDPCPPPICPETKELCEKPCEDRRKKRPGILHRIKLKITQGGTNFNSPFKKIKCGYKEKILPPEPIPKECSPLDPEERAPTVYVPDCRPGVRIALLGADTPLGQNLAFLLKQCGNVKRLNLYEAGETVETLDFWSFLCDLQQIDTNCEIHGFTYSNSELVCALEGADITVMLPSARINNSLPYTTRFIEQSGKVREYANGVALACPNTFTIVGTTPVDCMMPLVAECYKHSNCYNPCKIIGSLATQEMHARTIAADALSLDPRYTWVPCIGGTEDDSMLPLFSHAIDNFDFHYAKYGRLLEELKQSLSTAERMHSTRPTGIGDAHAMSKLVMAVSNALLCLDMPIITGFQQVDPFFTAHAKYAANPIELGRYGITRNFGFPKMSNIERSLIDFVTLELANRLSLVESCYYRPDDPNPQEACRKMIAG